MPRKKLGRPSKYSEKVADELLQHLAMGMSLRRACDQGEHLPSVATVFAWMRTHEDFLKQYTRAKQEAADMMAEDILDIADDGRNDWMEDEYQKGNTPGWGLNGEALQRSKLRVESRKWLMAKMKPKKYGDHIDVTSGGDKVQVAPIYGGVSTSDQPATGDEAGA